MRSRQSSRALVVAMSVATALLSACASSGGSSSEGTLAGTHSTPTHDRNLITANEMQGLNTVNLFEVVQRLHPEWLAQRNSTTPGKTKGLTQSTDTDVSVYIGDQRAGNSQFLRSMNMGSARSMRYFSASDSQVRFGTGNLNGVIQVTLGTAP